MTGLTVPTTVTYDEILFQGSPGPVDASKLSAEIKMELVGSTLQIWFRNTSLDAAGNAGNIEGSGLAFNLPAGVSLIGGSAAVASGSTLNGNGNGGGINSQWGYDFNGGNALGGGALAHSVFSYNARVSTMASDGKTSFDPNASNANGLNYGPVSSSETSPPGHRHVIDTLLLSLNLNLGSYSGNLVSDLDNEKMAVMFASPDSSNQPVPETGLTLGMLALAWMLMEGFRRKTR